MKDAARLLEDRIEDLAREIAATINEAEVPGRPNIRSDLKQFAIGLLQDTVVPPEPVAVATVDGTGHSFNPMAMAIPLFFAGGVLVFLFPPVGVMLFGASLVMVVWGLVVSLASRR